MKVTLLILSILLLSSAGLIIFFYNKYRLLLSRYENLKIAQLSYVDNIVDRICLNESAWLEQRTLLNVSLDELERIAANEKSDWETILGRHPGNKVVQLDDPSQNRLPQPSSQQKRNDGLLEITKRIRNRFWTYIPDDRSHLGGTVQTIDEFVHFVTLSIERFRSKKGIKIKSRFNLGKIDGKKFIFHDQDFIVRWFIFLSMFVRDSNLTGAPPSLEIDFFPGSNPNFYRVKTAFILFDKTILPEQFNSQYELYFKSGLFPAEWESMNQCLIEALRMSSVFSVLVKAEVNVKFGYTMIYFERDCYVVDDRSIFDKVIQLRKKYPASKLNYVADTTANYESTHLKDLLSEMGMDIQTVPLEEFSTSLLSRTILVFISSRLNEATQKRITKDILGCPFSKIRVCVISDGNEKYKRIHHERVQYIEIPLNKDSLNIIL